LHICLTFMYCSLPTMLLVSVACSYFTRKLIIFSCTYYLFPPIVFIETTYSMGAFLIAALAYYIVSRPTKKQRYKNELEACWKELHLMIEKSSCNPIMLRLAWSDAVTYDSDIPEWPSCGGVNGSVRFDLELNQPANAGLQKAVGLLLPIKKKFKNISWADCIQMAAVIGIKIAGGPLIELTYGREDAAAELFEIPSDDSCDSRPGSGSGGGGGGGSEENLSNPEKYQTQGYNSTTSSSNHNNSSNATSSSSSSSSSSLHTGRGKAPRSTKQLAEDCSIANIHVHAPVYPSAVPPYPDGAPSADVHIRNTFYRLGLNNRETVALCGGHTLGRAFQDRTGVCTFVSGNQGATLYTQPTAMVKVLHCFAVFLCVCVCVYSVYLCTICAWLRYHLCLKRFCFSLFV
jgi:hypothetical protein